jgi:hypothetical protein
MIFRNAGQAVLSRGSTDKDFAEKPSSNTPDDVRGCDFLENRITLCLVEVTASPGHTRFPVVVWHCLELAIVTVLACLYPCQYIIDITGHGCVQRSTTMNPFSSSAKQRSPTRALLHRRRIYSYAPDWYGSRYRTVLPQLIAFHSRLLSIILAYVPSHPGSISIHPPPEPRSSV